MVNVHLFGKQLTEPFSPATSSARFCGSVRSGERKKDHFPTSAKFNRGKASKKLTSPRYFADSVVLCNVFIADGIFPRRQGFRGEEISHDSVSDGTSPPAQIRLLACTLWKHACVLFGLEIVGKRIGPALEL